MSEPPAAGPAGGTPYDNYPLADETPTVPEPTTRVPRRKKEKPVKKTDTLVLDRVVDGLPQRALLAVAGGGEQDPQRGEVLQRLVVQLARPAAALLLGGADA